MNTKSTTLSRKPKAASHEWKQPFLDAFASTGRLNAACDEAGVVRQTIHYALRSDPEFAEEYRFAKEWFYDTIEAEAIRRACDGFQKPVFYHGKKIAEVTVYSDRLLEFLLKHRRPEPIPAVEQAPEDPQYDAQGRTILTPTYMAKLQVEAAKLMEEVSKPGYVSPYLKTTPEPSSEPAPSRDIPSGKETPPQTQTRNGAAHSPPQSSSQPTATISSPAPGNPPQPAPNPGSSSQSSPPKPQPAGSTPPPQPRSQSPVNSPAQPTEPPRPVSQSPANLVAPPRRPPRSGINRG